MCAESLIVPEPGNEMGRKPAVPITTNRLVLRRFNADDWKDLLEFLSDEELFTYVEGAPMEEERIIRWLQADSHVRLTTLNEAFCLGMEVQENGKLIGYLSLWFTDPQRSQAVINLFVNRSFQRKGLGREAVAGLIDFCFTGIKLHRVTAQCDSRNAAARRLFEKTGMRLEGEFRKDKFIDGEWRDSIWYALLNEEYRGTTSSPPVKSSE